MTMIFGHSLEQWAILFAWHKQAIGPCGTDVNGALKVLYEWESRYDHKPGDGAIAGVSYPVDWAAVHALLTTPEIVSSFKWS